MSHDTVVQHTKATERPSCASGFSGKISSTSLILSERIWVRPTACFVSSHPKDSVIQVRLSECELNCIRDASAKDLARKQNLARASIQIHTNWANGV